MSGNNSLYDLLHHHSKHIEYYLYTVKGEFLLYSSNPKRERSKLREIFSTKIRLVWTWLLHTNLPCCSLLSLFLICCSLPKPQHRTLSSAELLPQHSSLFHLSVVQTLTRQFHSHVKWRERMEVCLNFTVIWWLAHLQVFYKPLKGEIQNVRNVPVMMSEKHYSFPPPTVKTQILNNQEQLKCIIHVQEMLQH